jgi:transcriptional regulator with XRE-family HTH domain
MEFGNIIEEARINARLNQKELAARIIKEDGNHISAPYLNDIEAKASKASTTPLISLEQAAHALECETYDVRKLVEGGALCPFKRTLVLCNASS